MRLTVSAFGEYLLLFSRMSSQWSQTNNSACFSSSKSGCFCYSHCSWTSRDGLSFRKFLRWNNWVRVAPPPTCIQVCFSKFWKQNLHQCKMWRSWFTIGLLGELFPLKMTSQLNVLILERSIKTCFVWNSVILCLAVLKCFNPRAWNRSNFFAKARHLMPGITDISYS